MDIVGGYQRGAGFLRKISHGLVDGYQIIAVVMRHDFQKEIIAPEYLLVFAD